MQNELSLVKRNFIDLQYNPMALDTLQRTSNFLLNFSESFQNCFVLRRTSLHETSHRFLTSEMLKCQLKELLENQCSGRYAPNGVFSH